MSCRRTSAMSLLVAVLLVVSLLTLHAPVASARHGEFLPISVDDVLEIFLDPLMLTTDESISTVIAVVVLNPNNGLNSEGDTKVSGSVQSAALTVPCSQIKAD